MNGAELDNTALEGSKQSLLHKLKQDPVCVTARELDLPFLSGPLTLSKSYSRAASDLLKMCGERHPEDYTPTLPITTSLN